MRKPSGKGIGSTLIAVEAEIGIQFDFDTVCEIARYTARKLQAIGKGADYFPILFESELRDHANREVINMKGEMIYVCNLSSVPV